MAGKPSIQLNEPEPGYVPHKTFGLMLRPLDTVAQTGLVGVLGVEASLSPKRLGDRLEI